MSVAKCPKFTISMHEPALMTNLRACGLYDLVERHASEQRVTVADVLGEGRDAPVIRARHGAWKELRATTPMSYPEIGRLFGRDHTTVMVACRKAKHLTPPTPLEILAKLRVI